jgi:hypothetical protein
MKRISYSSLAFAAVIVLGVLMSGVAVALDGRDCEPPVYTPDPNSAVIGERVFNDCPFSNLSTYNDYPNVIWIRDSDDGCVGWTNMHNWSFSEDGITPAVYENCSHYRFSATFIISGCGAGSPEGGLRVSPWWSLDADGRFMANANGQIRCFGGRLPYYEFDTAHGINYCVGTPIWMEIAYDPHSLTEADPATITYTVAYLGNIYTSGPLPFDMGNPAEDPPHGLWGQLYPARVGGYFQVPNGSGGAFWDWQASWWDIQHFVNPWATPAKESTWGQLKSLYR